MTKTLHGRVHGKTIELDEDLGVAEGQELMALARSGKIKPTPMKEEPMGEVQKWIEELRTAQVVGRIVPKT